MPDYLCITCGDGRYGGSTGGPGWCANCIVFNHISHTRAPDPSCPLCQSAASTTPAPAAPAPDLGPECVTRPAPDTSDPRVRLARVLLRARTDHGGGEDLLVVLEETGHPFWHESLRQADAVIADRAERRLSPDAARIDVDAIRRRDRMDFHYEGRGPRWTDVHQDRRDLLTLLNEVSR